MLMKFTQWLGLAACSAAAAVLLSPSLAEAQMAFCGNRSAMIDALKAKYKESRQALGIAGSNSVVELYISEAGTWTMLVTSPEGRTCVMAAGHSWDGKPTLATGTAI
jgi:hypothetical protein